VSTVPSNKLVSLWIDFGPEFGSGHLYRCRGLIEFLRDLGCSLDIYTEVSARELKWVRDLEISGVVRIIHQVTAKFFNREKLIVDSYNLEINQELSRYRSGRAVRIIDATQQVSTASPILMQVVLEVEKNSSLIGIERQKSHEEGGQERKQLRGTLIWNSKLDEVANARTKPFNGNSTRNGKIVVLSYGGSSLVHDALEKTISVMSDSLKSNHVEKLVCFARKEVLTGLKKKFINEKNVYFKRFGDDFYSELKFCDLLISASGTTALEAYHLGIPTLVVDLFENASQNILLLKNLAAHSVVVDKASFNDIALFEILVLDALKRLQSTALTLDGTIQSSELKVIYEHLFSTS